MSWEATNWCVGQKAGSPAAKIILILLADRADEDHSCWPSQARLAEESEQSVATVRRHLRVLEDRGLVRTERRMVPGQKRATNRYVLAVDGVRADGAEGGVAPVSAAQDERQTGQVESDLPLIPDDLPLNLAHIYRSPVSAEPSVEPSGKEPSSAFDQFWAAYPRKIGKGQARRAFTAATKGRDPMVLVVAAVEFRQWTEIERTDMQFVPHPATWLNGERWLDERCSRTSGKSATIQAIEAFARRVAEGD